MGLAVYIALESPISGLNHIEMVNGKFAGQYWEELCEIAEKIGVQPPCEFSSMSRDELVDLIGDNVEVEPQLQWFDPHAGLASVRSKKSTNSIVFHGECITPISLPRLES